MLQSETLLRTRLASLTDFKGVYGLPELSGADLQAKASPAIYVIFDGYNVVETHPRGHSARVETRWLVVLVVKHYTQTHDGQSARLSAEPLVNQVLECLMGFHPPEWSKPLKLTRGPAPEFDSGLLMFPLAFTVEQLIRGEN